MLQLGWEVRAGNRMLLGRWAGSSGCWLFLPRPVLHGPENLLCRGDYISISHQSPLAVKFNTVSSFVLQLGWEVRERGTGCGSGGGPEAPDVGYFCRDQFYMGRKISFAEGTISAFLTRVLWRSNLILSHLLSCTWAGR